MDGGDKDGPDRDTAAEPPWHKSGPQVTLVVGVLAFVGLIFQGLVQIGTLDGFFSSDDQTTLSAPTEQVVGKTFQRQDVVIDNKIFIDCTFIGVRFIFNGTAGYTFAQGNKFEGKSLLYTDLRVVMDFIRLKNYLTSQATGAVMGEFDSDGVFHPKSIQKIEGQLSQEKANEIADQITK